MEIWQEERDSCMVWACHTPQQPPHNHPSRHLWRMGNAVVSRANAGWTTSKSGYPCPSQNCSQWSPAYKTGRGSLLNHLLHPPDDPISQGTKLNWWEDRFRKNGLKRGVVFRQGDPSSGVPLYLQMQKLSLQPPSPSTKKKGFSWQHRSSCTLCP